MSEIAADRRPRPYFHALLAGDKLEVHSVFLECKVAA